MTETTHAPIQAAPPSEQPTRGSGLAITSLVLGLVALLLAFIPIINNFAFFLAIIGLIFGLVAWRGARKGKRTGKGMAVAGVILAVLSGAGVLVSQQIYSDALDDLGDEISGELDRASGGATGEILAEDLDLTIGEFTVTESEFSDDTSLTVSVMNKSDERQSFDVKIEAVDSEGARIDDDSGYVSDLGPGQSTEIELFQFVDEGQIQGYTDATFQIVSVSAN